MNPTRRAALLERRTADLAVPTMPLVPNLESRVVPSGQIEVRAGDDSGDGTFEGWALLWNTTDSYGTRFRAGAFAATLDADPYALLWMHDPWVVLGTFTAEERDRGLWIAGAFDPTPEGQAGRARARSRSASELSVGFSRTTTNPDDDSEITEALLVETSQITARMAAVPGAGFTDSRAAEQAVNREREARRARALLALSVTL